MRDHDRSVGFPRAPESLAKMLRADSADAGIPNRDDSGGVHSRIDRAPAPHGIITFELTKDRYSHTVIHEQAAQPIAIPAERAFGIETRATNEMVLIPPVR